MLAVGIIGLVALIASAPAIGFGIFGAHDLVSYHINWGSGFAEQVWLGDVYPRWLFGMNAGLGSPVFFYYAPAGYYAVALMHPFFPNDAVGWYQVVCAAALGLAASGVAFHVWVKDLVGERVAVLGAVVYMLLPYHLAVDLYARFAYGELWAFVWIPLVLLAARRMTGRERLPLIGFAVGLALLFLSHIVSFVMFAPVAVGYAVIIAETESRRRAMLRALIGLALAVGLAAIYWLPALGLQRHVGIGAGASQAYTISNNFLFSAPPVGHNLAFWRVVETVTVLSGAMAVCAFVATRVPAGTALRREQVGLMCLAMVSVFMTLPVSAPIWAISGPLQRIEFPWRFNVILTVATAGLVTLAIASRMEGEGVHGWGRRTFGAMVLLLVLSAMVGFGVMGLRLRPISDAQRAALPVRMEGTSYKPNAVPATVYGPSAARALSERNGRARLESGRGEVSVEAWAPRMVALRTRGGTPLSITLGQFYFPGWTAWADDQAAPLPAGPSTENGLVRLEVPAGDHRVMVRLEPTTEERLGRAASALTALIVAALALWFRRSDRGSLPLGS